MLTVISYECHYFHFNRIKDTSQTNSHGCCHFSFNQKYIWIRVRAGSGWNESKGRVGVGLCLGAVAGLGYATIYLHWFGISTKHEFWR